MDVTEREAQIKQPLDTGRYAGPRSIQEAHLGCQEVRLTSALSQHPWAFPRREPVWPDAALGPLPGTGSPPTNARAKRARHAQAQYLPVGGERGGAPGRQVARGTGNGGYRRRELGGEAK